MRHRILPLLAAAVLFAGCDVRETVTLETGNFTWRLYRELGSDPAANLFFSPYSVGAALSMAREGAAGATRAEIDRLLGWSDGSEKFIRLSRDLPEQREVQFEIGNSIWPQAGLRLKPAFTEAMERDFHASSATLDYRKTPAFAARTINAWVEEKTQGRIAELLSPDALSELTRLVLVNTIYFRGDWQLQFKRERTQLQPFYPAPERPVETRLMNQTGFFGYAENADWQLLRMDYANLRFAMLVLLPRPGVVITEVEKQLSDANLAAWLKQLEPRRVDVTLPAFESEYRAQLSEHLQRLGCRLPFDPAHADFSGLTGDEPLFIDKVIHQANVSVDEQGTVAAAATAVTIVRSAMPPQEPPVEFRADRPFIYLIVDTETAAVLFAGRLVNPSK